MKKIRYVLAVVVLLIICTSCEEPADSNANSIVSVDDIISEQMAQEDSGAASNGESSSAADATSDDASDAGDTSDSAEDSAASDDEYAADIDLTVLSSTMVYAEVYNLVTMPLVYHGSTVKLTGYYDEYYDVMTDTLYCSVFVMDALGCCAQGLQVEFSDEYAYPDEYPEDGSEITIFATFEIYYPDPDSTSFYYHLVDTIVLE